ncbi:MAG: diguanylate cyclase [Nitrospirae bacterium]|nr:diguanylate cyclase [Nitrospirota bacterium]
MKEININWLYNFKKKVIFVLIGVIFLAIVLSNVLLKRVLLNESKAKTHELALSIQSCLNNLMIAGDPDAIQATLEKLGSNNESIIKVFIIDRNGKIAYSSKKEEIGNKLDRHTDKNCTGCHMNHGTKPFGDALLINYNGLEVHRNISVLYNSKECYGCHDSRYSINGKLIIDRSLKNTNSLIISVDLFMVGFAVILLPFLFVFLSKSFNKYINEIIIKHTEISLLYSLVNRLSKTIEIEELKSMVVDILKETLDADEVDIVVPREESDYRVLTWTLSSNKIVRRKVDEDDPLAIVIINWIKGMVRAEIISDDKKQILLPIEKNEHRLALIAARSTKKPFDTIRLMLIKAIISHVAVAFENARLYSIAITDELTGLYSQRHFNYRMDKMFYDFIKYGEKLTLLMLDIDDFKKVNDTYGHMVGDIILKEIAGCIIESIKQTDVAFRYGGEEFTVLLRLTDLKDGKYVSERIRKSIEHFVFDKGNHNIKLTVSIGVSNCPDNALTIYDLKLTADKALYEAKGLGKNRTVVSDAQPKL